MWAGGMQGPWSTERYSELDIYVWYSEDGHIFLKNVGSDSLIIKHRPPNVECKIHQELKAFVEAEHGKELWGATSESEQQRASYNEITKESIRGGKTEDMDGFMETLARAAEEKLTLRPPRIKERDCHPELERLVACRKIALERDEEDGVKRLTKLLKGRARRIRTEGQIISRLGMGSCKVLQARICCEIH